MLKIRRDLFIKLGLSLMVLFVPFTGFAQQNVRGRVVDSEGQPLPGASVVIKGTTLGTITNDEGNYSLNDIPEDATLVFSFVGMKTEEVVVSNQTTINVTLELDAVGIEEVITIGYATRRKGELTGSVTSIGNEKIENAPEVNVINSLQGKASGLIVNDRGGEPGAPNLDFLVRGTSTLGNNAPLIVIDGVPRDNLNFIAASDIQSITVLKDASAAIYGARAANGVLLVETKKGKKGEAKFSFTANQRISKFTRLEEQMDSWEFAEYMNEIDNYAGRIPKYSEEDIAKFKAGDDPINYPNTNWPEEVMKDWTSTQQYDMSVSGGNESVNYYLSGRILDQGGQWKSGDANYNQYDLRSNIDIQVHKYLKLGVELYGSRGDKDRPAIDVDQIYLRMRSQNMPTLVAVYPNGLLGYGGENGNNALALSSKMTGSETDERKWFQSKISMDLDLSWLTLGLQLKGYASLDYHSNLSKIFHDTWTVYDYNATRDEYLPVTGFAINEGNFKSLRQTYNTNMSNFYNIQLMYKRTFNDHTINGFVAYEQSEGENKFLSGYRRDIISDEIQELFAGSSDGMTNDGGSSEWGRMNYFGNIAYNYQNKYLIDFTLRHDGSYNFPQGKRFGTFPGVSAAWRMTNEEFMSNLSWLPEFKLRASWAKMGNDRVASYQYLTQYRFGGNSGVWNHDRNWYAFGISPNQVNTFIKSQTPNPNITWETSEIINAGFDASFIEGKLSASFDYFYEKRRDILIQRSASIPDYAALSLPDENLGKVDNSGFETTVNYRNTVNDLRYEVGFNLTYTRNKVVYLDEPANVYDWQKIEGFPSASYLLYKTDGIFNSQEEIDATKAVLPGTQPGDIKYVDVSGDDEITGDDRYRRYASNIPDFQGAFNLGLFYKRIGLNVLFTGQAGHVENFYDFHHGVPFHKFKYEGRWTEEKPDANFVRAHDAGDPINTRISDYWLRNSSFIRLKNLELSYTVPQIWEFSQVRLYVTGSNLWTLDHVNFSDPEATNYPPLTTILFGVNLNF